MNEEVQFGWVASHRLSEAQQLARDMLENNRDGKKDFMNEAEAIGFQGFYVENPASIERSINGVRLSDK